MPATTEEYQSCFQAYANRDYAACIRQAMAIIGKDSSPSSGTFTTIQLLLISLQRTGQTELLAKMAPLVRAAIALPFYKGLIALTLGEADPAELALEASSDEEKCRFFFYFGARRVTLGQTEGAVKPFEMSQAGDEGVIEAQLARAELFHLRSAKPAAPAPVPPPPAPASPPVASDESARTEVARLGKEVIRLYREKQFDGALEVATRATDLARTALGTADGEYARCLNNLAEVLRALGRHAEAIPLIQECIEVWRPQLGDHHRSVFSARINLQESYRALGDEAAAKAVEARVEAASKANALGTMVNIVAAKKDPAQLAIVLRQLVEALRDSVGTGDAGYLQRVVQLARTEAAAGHAAEADAAYREAITRMGAAEPLSVSRLTVVTEFVQTLLAARNAAAAAEVVRELHGLTAAPANGSATEVATALNRLGLLFEDGMIDVAAPLFRSALAICKSAGATNTEAYGDSLSNVGAVFVKLRDADGATPLFAEALEVYRRTIETDQPKFATALHNLALAYRWTANFFLAEPLYRESLAILRRTVGPDDPAYANALNSLANIRRAVDDYESAEPMLREVAGIRRRALGDGHPEYAAALSNLAVCCHDVGRHEEAETLHRQALDIRRAALGDDHPDTVTSRQNLCAAVAALGRAAEAFALVREAASAEDRVIGRTLAVGSEEQRLTYLREMRMRVDGFLSVCGLPGIGIEGHRAGMDLVLRRKGLSAESLAAQRDAVLGGRYPAMLPLLAELARLRAAISEATLAGGGEDRVRAESARRTELEADLARQIPEVALVERMRGANRDSVAAALPAGSVLVEFVRHRPFDFYARLGKPWQPDRYLAFLLPAGEPDAVTLVDLGDAKAIDDAVAAHLDAIVELAPDAERVAGRTLRALVFDPLVQALGARVRLLLSPDGELSRLPFEVLPDADGGRLIDRYEISYLSAGRDVLRFGRSARDPGPALVAADPDFDLPAPAGQPVPAEGGWSLGTATPLPGTRAEALRVADELGVAPLLGAAVIEASLRGVRSPEVLHLATHGFVLPDPSNAGQLLRLLQSFGPEGPRNDAPVADNPLLRSGLILAGYNTRWVARRALPPDAGDGVLTAEDVTGMDLLDTELAVLSACDTGLGSVRTGEGVFGLRRAFPLAGARTLVISLWKVPDEATAELMADFYRRLCRGEPRAAALRGAQLAVKAQYPDPFYWGAFVCQGDPTPLRAAAATLPPDTLIPRTEPMPDQVSAEIARLEAEIARLSSGRDFPAAAAAARRLCDLIRERLGGQHPLLVKALRLLAEQQDAAGDSAAASATYRDALAVMAASFAAVPWDLVERMARVSRMADAVGPPPAADEYATLSSAVADTRPAGQASRGMAPKKATPAAKPAVSAKAGATPPRDRSGPLTRRGTVRYYTHMLPKKVYPLTVILSAEELEKIVDQAVAQASSGPFELDGDTCVEVEPILAGCQCYPPRQDVAVGDGDTTVRFQVLGEAEGDIPEARVVIRQAGRVLAEIPLTVQVRKRQASYVLWAAGLAYPYVLKYFRLDVESQKESNYSEYWKALDAVASLPWWVIPAALVSAGLGWWLWRRPRQTNANFAGEPVA